MHMKNKTMIRIGNLHTLLILVLLIQSLAPGAQDVAPSDLKVKNEKVVDSIEPDKAEANNKKTGITGPELIELYSDVPRVELADGFYYQEIYEGTGNETADGHVVYVMARGFNADGAELRLGSDNHSHPDEVSSEHGHGLHAYSGRWFVYGYGGGNLNMGTEKMNENLFAAMKGMRENGKRLIYISADNAYGKTGYKGHDFKIQPDTNLLIEISLIRVRFVESPEGRGLQ